MDYNAAIKEMMEGYGQETPDCPIEFYNLGYEFRDSIYDAMLALDKVVDGLVAMSEGRMPEGVDPSMYPEGFNPSGFKS